MRDRNLKSAAVDLPRDGKRAPRGAKSKAATLARRKARQVKYAKQGR